MVVPRRSLRVTMFTTPVKAVAPALRAAAPSSTSMRSMSIADRGKSAERCPVWGEVMLTPLSMTVTWSKVPPPTPMSVCTPCGPRCRTSTAAESFTMSPTVCAPAAAMSERVMTVTRRAAKAAGMGACCVSATASPNARVSSSKVMLSACAPGLSARAALRSDEAWAAAATDRVATDSTPTFTSCPNAAKSDQRLPAKWRKTNDGRPFPVCLFCIKNK